MAQVAKPVRGIYQIVNDNNLTIQAIALDKAAIELAEPEEENVDSKYKEDKDFAGTATDKKSRHGRRLRQDEDTETAAYAGA